MSANGIIFDWVTERHGCSIDSVFEKLRLDVKSDLDTRKNLGEQHDTFSFEPHFSFSSSQDAFSASVHFRNGNKRAAIFRRGKGYIGVADVDDKEIFRASLTLNKERQCRLVVDGEELEDWQFRMKVLEPVLFGDVPK
jgi:hypothetical protein